MTIAEKLTELSSQYDIEFTGSHSYKVFHFDDVIDEYNSKQVGKITLGVKVDKSRWAWFHSYDNVNGVERIYFHFSHVYNQNTGKTVKAWNTGWKLIQKLNLNY
jgi:hypothetical protein